MVIIVEHGCPTQKQKIACIVLTVCFLVRNRMWNQRGVSNSFNTWKNGTLSIIAHEASEAHVDAISTHKLRTTSLPILPSITQEKKIEILLNQEIVKKLIDITVYLAQHCLAFRGHREGWSEPLQGNL